MSLIDQIYEEQKMQKKLVFFKYFILCVVVLSFISILYFFINSYFVRKKVQVCNQISDFIVQSYESSSFDDEKFNYLISKYKKERYSSIDVIRMYECITKVSQINNTVNRSNLVKVIKIQKINDYFSNLAKIIWMNKVLDQKFDDISNQERNDFLCFANDFQSPKELFFFRAKILESIFLIQDKKIDLAKVKLKDIISSHEALHSIKTEAQSILSTIL